MMLKKWFTITVIGTVVLSIVVLLVYALLLILSLANGLPYPLNHIAQTVIIATACAGVIAAIITFFEYEA